MIYTLQCLSVTTDAERQSIAQRFGTRFFHPQSQTYCIPIAQLTVNERTWIQALRPTHSLDQTPFLVLDMSSPSKLQPLEEQLYEICEREHSACNSNCPVFRANGDQIPKMGNECSCFKSGRAMRLFLEKHS